MRPGLTRFQRGNSARFDNLTDPTVDPATEPGFVGWVRHYSSGPARWEWNLQIVQLVWDHQAGRLAANLWNEDWLAGFVVRNAESSAWRTFGIFLRYHRGSACYLFHSDSSSRFSYSGQPIMTIYAATLHRACLDQNYADFDGPRVDLTLRCSEPGMSIAVAIPASRGPGR